DFAALGDPANQLVHAIDDEDLARVPIVARVRISHSADDVEPRRMREHGIGGGAVPVTGNAGLAGDGRDDAGRRRRGRGNGDEKEGEEDFFHHFKVRRRITLLPVSAITIEPSGAIFSPTGALNFAVAASPSAKPLTPSWPATVINFPSIVSIRMAWLNVSTMKTWPAALTSMPLGVFRCVSSLPDTPGTPATVVTVPSGAMRRTVWFPASVT